MIPSIVSEALSGRTKDPDEGENKISFLPAEGLPVSLYLHYPFCVRKCSYCDFLSGPAEDEVRSRFLLAEEEEICSVSASLGNGRALFVDTVFFGGGTPSLMTPEELEQLMSVLNRQFRIAPDAEITLECNPGTADFGKLKAYRSCGINRLSVGVQSFRDEELRMLGRIHTRSQAAKCLSAARKAGFSNLSIDLISALPGQTPDQWMENLRQAVSFSPEHISAYSLILEDGTPLKEAARSGLLAPVPDEDTDRRMYHETKSYLSSSGYHRYEISNYAQKGFESRHNSGYWTEHPYLGFGPGAASYLVLEDGRRVRWNNPGSLTRYLRHASCENVEVLSVPDQMAEFMFLGLRRTEGVRPARFRERFGTDMEQVYRDVIRRYCELGLLEYRDGFLRLTDAGIDVSNTVMADFLPD